jgi:chromate transporter
LPQAPLPALSEATKTFAQIGWLSFGGPAGQIALMHRMLVEERGWLTERQFLNALNFCMLLPGPEAMQLATYAGWKLHGARGGLIAGLLFVAPGALIILTLSALYAWFGTLAPVTALFLGIKAAVLAILAQALFRLSQRALKTPLNWALAAAAFFALAILALPFPLIIAGAALAGYFLNAKDKTPPTPIKLNATDLARTVLIWLSIWLAPVAALLAILGPDHVLAELGLFFSKLAIITFGGAYAVLTVMAEEAVAQGWINPAQMIDGLGLAETTPGPLILVTQFVGFLAGYKEMGTIAGGLAGAAITLWVTFAPCFLWIFAGAPYVEALATRPRLTAALSGITAAVVGVILNLGLWFAYHTLWMDGLNWKAVALSLIGAFLLFRLNWGIPALLASLALAGLALSYFPG